MSIPVLPDNATVADLGDEPEGFWDAAQAQIDAWVNTYGQEDDGDTN